MRVKQLLFRKCVHKISVKVKENGQIVCYPPIEIHTLYVTSLILNISTIRHELSNIFRGEIYHNWDISAFLFVVFVIPGQTRFESQLMNRN